MLNNYPFYYFLLNYFAKLKIMIFSKLLEGSNKTDNYITLVGLTPLCSRFSLLVLSLCLFVSMSLCLYVSLFLCLYVSMSLCFYVSMSLCLYVSMSLCLYVSMSLCIFVSMSLFLYVSLFLCLNVSISLYLCLSQTLPNLKYACLPAPSLSLYLSSPPSLFLLRSEMPCCSFFDWTNFFII
jgi:hypothetical protein